MTTPWIIPCDGTDPACPHGFVCLRCGQTKTLPEGLPVTRYLALAKIFRMVHAKCEGKDEQREPI